MIIVGIVFGILVFRLAMGMDWHIGIAIFMALVPVGATLFLGVFGVVASALFLGSMYKASAG